MGVKDVADALKQIKNGCDILERGPTSYYLQCLVKAHELLLNEYAPFKVGDRVELSKTPVIGDDSGWRGSRHFLIEGARGTVREVEVHTKGLSCAVEFDDESYLHYNTQEVIPIVKKHTYAFGPGHLRHAIAKPGENLDLFGVSK